MVWSFGGVLAQALPQVLATALLGRLLEPADYGVAMASGLVVALVALCADAGLGSALVQRQNLEGRHWGVAQTLALTAGSLAGGAVAVSAPLLAVLLHVPQLAQTLPWAALALPIGALAVLPEASLHKTLRIPEAAAAELAALTLGTLGVGVTLAAWGLGYWALIAASVVQAGLRAGLMLWRARPWPRPAWDASAARQLLAFGVPVALARLGNFVGAVGDEFAVGRLCGPAAMGVYDRASLLVRAPSSQFSSALDRVLFPVLAMQQADRPALARTYLRCHTAAAALLLPASVALGLLAHPAVVVALGPQWGDAVAPLQCLAASVVLRASFKISDIVTRATHRVGPSARRHAVFAMLVCGLAAAGAQLGLGWAAGGAATAIGVQCLWMAQLALGICGLGWRPWLATLRPGLLLAAGAAVVSQVTVLAASRWSWSAGCTLSVAGLCLAAGGALWLRNAHLRRLLGADMDWALRHGAGLTPAWLRGLLRPVTDGPAASPGG